MLINVVIEIEDIKKVLIESNTKINRNKRIKSWNW